jgi:3-oxoacyl-[acyl-carrier protein] reductase
MTTASQKTAIVTGASRGIGSTIAKRLARDGFAVAVNYTGSAAQADEVVDAIKAASGQAIAIQADISKAGDVLSLFKETQNTYGRIDVVVNNAGIMPLSPIAKSDTEVFDKVIAINLRGVFLGMKYVLPHMVKLGAGSIINQASIAGMIAIRGGAAYSASKAGVIALTRVAALEYGRYNIRVNCICPGAIETPMAERIRHGEPPRPGALKRVSVFGRMGLPEEIAKMALFLASDDSSFATGAPFVVDAGWTVS